MEKKALSGNTPPDWHTESYKVVITADNKIEHTYILLCLDETEAVNTALHKMLSTINVISVEKYPNGYKEGFDNSVKL